VSIRWDPEQYLRYEDERGRPFGELLTRIPLADPREVVDLGCGPGNTTAQLLQRWPHARILGVDSSAEMIEQARTLAVPDRLEFRQGDLREWRPDRPVDVLLSAATFQWVTDHAALFPALVDALAPGGAFAFQVPANFGEPSHVLLQELATSDRWGDRLRHLVRPTPVLEPAAYLRALLATGASADVWETTYLHVLRGANPVLEWVQGTALRPYLSALGADESDEFGAAYAAVLRAAYPVDAQGRTVFPFRRIFAVAVAGGGPA
jgi:trans-aconitate 2-methyltransferase